MWFFLSRYIHYWIKPSGKTTKQTPLAFIFLYILMSPNPNISHWEGTCMQTSFFSFINDDLQIKPFGARSWHFPKQTMKSKDQSLSCSKQEGTAPRSERGTGFQLLPDSSQMEDYSVTVLLHCLLSRRSCFHAGVLASRLRLREAEPLLAVAGRWDCWVLRAFSWGS